MNGHNIYNKIGKLTAQEAVYESDLIAIVAMWLLGDHYSRLYKAPKRQGTGEKRWDRIVNQRYQNSGES